MLGLEEGSAFGRTFDSVERVRERRCRLFDIVGQARLVEGGGRLLSMGGWSEGAVKGPTSGQCTKE